MSNEVKKTDKGMIITVLAVVIVVIVAIVGTVAGRNGNKNKESGSVPVNNSDSNTSDASSEESLVSDETEENEESKVTNPSSQVVSNETESEKPPVSSENGPSYDDYLGKWGNGVDCGGFYEREITIKRITENSIVFDAFYYRLWGADGVYAYFSNNKAYFNNSDGVKGYISFSGNIMTVTITETFDEGLVETGTFKYKKY